MTPSFLRTLVLPPRYDETVRVRQWRLIAKMHLIFVVVALTLDAGIYIALRGNPDISQPALQAFMLINYPSLLAAALLWGVVLASRREVSLKVPLIACTLQTVTMLVWVQVTGSVTSYFMLAGFLVIVIYRLYIGYWMALVYAAVTAAGHWALVLLEQLGVLPSESLFLGGTSPVYTVPAYPWLALISISWVYVVALVGANLIVNKLRAKDEVIAEIRAEAARAAEDVQHGRLTGSVLAEEYALGELLGRGGMGEVYAAHRLSDEKLVAVKVLHGHLIANDTALARFHREAEIARKLPPEHTAAVLAVDYDPGEGLHYLVMEHLQGEDLGAYVRRRGPLRMDELLAIVRQAAVALDHAHGIGVLHRDMKPQNIFLVRSQQSSTAPPEVRLLDFGMAKLLRAEQTTLTQDGAMLGTVAYMAPEQALGRPDAVGEAADRFALAGVIYRALTGRPPFQAGELISAIREILHVDPPPVSELRPDLHRDVDAVLALGLAKNPDLRPETALELVSLLEQAATGALADEVHQRAQQLSSFTAEAATVMDSQPDGASES